MLLWEIVCERHNLFKTKLVAKEILSITIKPGIDNRELVCMLFFKLIVLYLSYWNKIESFVSEFPAQLKIQLSDLIFGFYVD